MSCKSQWITDSMGLLAMYRPAFFTLNMKKGFYWPGRVLVMKWWSYCWQVVGFFPVQAVMTLTAVTGEKQFGLLTHVSTVCCQGTIPGHVWQTRRWEQSKLVNKLSASTVSLRTWLCCCCWGGSVHVIPVLSVIDNISASFDKLVLLIWVTTLGIVRKSYFLFSCRFYLLEILPIVASCIISWRR